MDTDLKEELTILYSGTNSATYGSKIMSGETLALLVGNFSPNDKMSITVDEYGETMKISGEGSCFLELKLEISKIKSACQLRIKRNNSIETLSLMYIERLGKKHSTAIFDVNDGDILSIVLEGETEIIVKEGSLSLHLYMIE